MEIDIFWLKVIASFFLGGGYIAFTIFLAEKFGSKLAGIILGLPSTSLVGVICIAWSQGTDTLLTALPITPAALALCPLFSMMFVMFYKNGIKTSFGAALLVWGCSALSLIFLNPDIILSIIIGTLIFVITIWYLQRFRHKKIEKHHSSNLEFIYRSVFAGSVIVIALILSKFFGPIWGGVFAVFPAAFSSSLYLLSKKHGFEFVSAVARTMPFGSIGTAIFTLSLYFLIPGLGLVLSIVLAYLLSLFYAAAIYVLHINK